MSRPLTPPPPPFSGMTTSGGPFFAAYHKGTRKEATKRGGGLRFPYTVDYQYVCFLRWQHFKQEQAVQGWIAQLPKAEKYTLTDKKG